MIKKLFRFIFIIVILIIAFFVYSGWKKHESATSVSISEKVELIRAGEDYTKIEDVSETFLQAICSVEDRRFYNHKGVDVFSMARALVRNVKDKKVSEGASTITQQLAKNIYYMGEDTLSRKIAEMFTAIEIEKNYTKEEILELYINVIYYGSGHYNIYDASKGYFDKTPDKLNAYEATLLAGVVNAPSVYSPDANIELAHKRQEKVLETMVKNKHITKDEKAEILHQQKSY